jgi:hypothetical protein
VKPESSPEAPRTQQAEPSPCFNLLGLSQGTHGTLAPCSGFLLSRAARSPSAVHDTWRVTRLNRVHQAPRGKFGENSPHLLGNIEKGKSKKKSLGGGKYSLGLVVTAFPGAKTRPAIMFLTKRLQESSRCAAELSPRTFCTFACEFSPLTATGCSWAAFDPGQLFSSCARATALSDSPGRRLNDVRARGACGRRRRSVNRWSCGCVE